MAAETAEQEVGKTSAVEEDQALARSVEIFF
jgi:hypothetical protein